MVAINYGLQLAYKQWGKYQDKNIANRTVNIYFPINFKSNCYAITVCNIFLREYGDNNTNIKAMSSSNFTAFIDDFDAGFYYIAIGV